MPAPGFRFKIGPFPVTVHWSFFLLVLIGAFSGSSLQSIVIWGMAVFISLILHELGHAMAANRYGFQPSIELMTFGGLTRYAVTRPLHTRQQLLIQSAGVMVGFTFAAMLFAFIRLAPSVLLPPIILELLSQLILINLIWGIFNLLPMLPMDGGQIMRSLWLWRKPLDQRTPLIISIVVGVLVAGLALWLRQTWILMIVLWLTFQNISSLNSPYPPSPRFDDYSRL